MAKMMFSDAVGLTDAVIRGVKTSTCRDEVLGRFSAVRFMSKDVLREQSNSEGFISDRFYGYSSAKGWELVIPKFSVGQRVAVAQAYKDIDFGDIYAYHLGELKASAGWSNKMFVKSELMPHVIEITEVRVVKVRSLGMTDILTEGVEVHDQFELCYRHRTQGLRVFDSSEYRFAWGSLLRHIGCGLLWDADSYVFQYKFKLVK